MDLEHALGDEPYSAFERWFDEAAATIAQADAFALASSGADGEPTVRMLLFKGFSGRGLRFFSNYDSAKARELAANPRAAMLFFWQPQHRQVRIAGAVERLSRAESEAYFATRDRESQLGAWASRQSAPLASRDALMDAYRRVEDEFQRAVVPCPPSWGGYRLLPERFEFWQGRAGRLHDRIAFVRDGEQWHRGRLAP